MKSSTYLKNYFFAVTGALIVLIAGGCAADGGHGYDYDSVFKMAAQVLDVTLKGTNPVDAVVLKRRYVGQSANTVAKELTTAQKKVPGNVVVEWVKQTDRLEIRVGMKLSDERMAYALMLFLDDHDLVRDVSWSTVSFPLETKGYLE